MPPASNTRNCWRMEQNTSGSTRPVRHQGDRAIDDANRTSDRSCLNHWNMDSTLKFLMRQRSIQKSLSPLLRQSKSLSARASHGIPSIGFSGDPSSQGTLVISTPNKADLAPIGYRYALVVLSHHLPTRICISRLRSSCSLLLFQLPINRPMCPVLNRIRDGEHH